METKNMNALSISNFSFAYPDQNEILSGVSLDLAPATFALLVGATGSGKTTLLRSVKPELAPAGQKSGTIEVFGRTIDDLDVGQSAELIGYVSQSPENQIVCDSVWHELAFGMENLGTAPDAMRRRLAEIAYFFGLESLIHEPIASLSGGQKQVVTLASVLVMQPKLLLLDEPTAQLDPIAEKNFLHALFRINRELGITIVVATHTPEAMLSYATDAFRITDHHLEKIELGSCANSLAVSPVASHAAEEILHNSASDESTTHDSSVMASDNRRKSLIKKKAVRAEDFSVRLDDVFFRYQQDEPWVLRGIDLKVEPGTIHAIIGGNGSGKSTILHVIADTLKPQRGRVTNKLSETQALLPQNPKALFVCDSVDEELREWQSRVGYTDQHLAEMIERFDLASLLAQHPYDLSGGQQQKLALAKLLLTQPRLLLLDEPTKGLDRESKREIARNLADLKASGATIVLVTHDLDFVQQVADRATMLFDGQAACSEPIEDFFANNLFYRLAVDTYTEPLRAREREDTSRTPNFGAEQSSPHVAQNQTP